MMMSEVYRENLSFFEGPNPENDAWFKNLTTESRNRMHRFVKNANFLYANAKRNGIPSYYKPYLEYYKANMRQNDAASQVNLEAIYALDTVPAQTMWESDTFSKIGLPTEVMSMPRWSEKKYLIQSESWPAFTKSFQNPAFISMKDTPGFSNGVGLIMGVSASWVDIKMSGGGLWSPVAFMQMEAATKMGLQKSRRGFLGTSCQYAQAADGSDAADFGVTGLFNDALVQTEALGAGADNVINAQGDLEYSLYSMLGDLKKCYAPGEIIILSTSGIASEMFRQRDTYQTLSDITRIRSLFLSGVLGRWIVTDQLLNAAATNTTQYMMMLKNDGSIVHKIVFPSQVLPMNDRQYESDLKEAHVFGDIIEVRLKDTSVNAYPFTKNSAAVETTGTGFIPEGTDITSWIKGGWQDYRGVSG